METKIALSEAEFDLVMRKIAQLEELINLELNKNEVAEFPHNEKN